LQVGACATVATLVSTVATLVSQMAQVHNFLQQTRIRYAYKFDATNNVINSDSNSGLGGVSGTMSLLPIPQVK
jgi:hypothetical protein